MNVVPYVNFDGNCKDAFTFYQKVFKGEIVEMITHQDMPMGGPEWDDKIMHAHLDFQGHQLMGSDLPPGDTTTPQGFAVSLHFDSNAEAEDLYAQLSEGGTIMMPLEKTEWATRFAMFNDRFGTPWIINCHQPE